MTLETTQCSVTYKGNGQSTSFPLPFPWNNKFDLVVRGTTKEGEDFTYAIGVDYEVAERSDEAAGQGYGSVELTVPLPRDWTLHIQRIVPLTQEHIFHNQGPNSPRVIEQSLDKLTMAVQQQQQQLEELNQAKADSASLRDLAYADDAPADGNTYARKNGQWSSVTPSGLPGDGASGDILTRDESVNSTTWVTPDTVMARMSEATASAKGLMSAADKARFSGGGMVYPGFTMYLSPTGNDSTADGSSARPFQTINGLINFLRTKYPGRIGRLNLVFSAGRFLSPYANWFPLNSACQVEDLLLSGANTANVYDTSIIYSEGTTPTFTCEREDSVKHLYINNVSFAGSGNVAASVAIVHFANKGLHVAFGGYAGFYNEHPTARRTGWTVDYETTIALYSTYQLFSGGSFLNAIYMLRGSKLTTYGAQRYTFRDTDVTNTIFCESNTWYLAGGPVPVFTNVTGTGAVVARERATMIFTGSGRAPGFSPTGTVTKDANAYITDM